MHRTESCDDRTWWCSAPPSWAARDAAKFGAVLDRAALDRFGFFEELHGRLDSAQSKIKGIYLAGSCQAPMDIQRAISQGMAAAGYVLSGLAEGKKLEIEPITASVDEDAVLGMPDLRRRVPVQGHRLSPETETSRECAALPRLRHLRGGLPGGRHQGQPLHQRTDSCGNRGRPAMTELD